MSRALGLAIALAIGAGCTETLEVAVQIEVAAGQFGCPDSLEAVQFPFDHSIHLHVFATDSDRVEVLARDCADIGASPGRNITALPQVLAENIDIGPLEPSGRLVQVELVVYHQPVEFCEPFTPDRAGLQLFARTEVRLDEDLEVVPLRIECVDVGQ